MSTPVPQDGIWILVPQDENPTLLFTPAGNGAAVGGGGSSDHGALTGLTDDDHTQYALADGSRGTFATAAQGALADTAVQPAVIATKLDDLAAGTEAEIVGANAAGTVLQRLGYTVSTLLAAAYARASHTGTQFASTISDFASAALAAVTWSTLTGKPSVFTPDTHAHAAADITSGTLAHERGGLEADVSAYSGLLKIASGSTSAVTVTAAGEALLDDADASAQRTTLGLGNSATRDVGTTAGTVAAGDDSRLSDARTPTTHDQGSDTITSTLLDVTGTTHTAAASDDGKIYRLTHASGCAVTIPDTLSAGWSVGWLQVGNAQSSFAGSGSMVVTNRQSHTKTAGRYASGGLIVQAVNSVYLLGDTGA